MERTVALSRDAATKRKRVARLKAGVVKGEVRARVAKGFRDPAAHESGAASGRSHTQAERAARLRAGVTTGEARARVGTMGGQAAEWARKGMKGCVRQGLHDLRVRVGIRFVLQ